ncbi:Thioredoxin-like [Rubritalea squalenifaciens DSM 18772]|uniref:Thioredoxin-like n=1 Tax=Rubritalea squalenifaciens DSM 18772 TaxID=1123071 RepID=A0A1M6J103_9BACT|nr:thioredoxin domain-containing protein [Rubritalea squalenifaciens]SHJ40355.1 Thioredoxin-like [Rubritalea squalenifaciens DSM 18772]
MNIIKKLSITLFALLAFSGISLAGDGWMTNIEQALAKAKTSKKPVMVEFTGSDWCPPCIRMHKQVFSKDEFLKKASKGFILVKIDIPNGNKDLRAKNEPVLQKHKVRGVPTVIVFSPEGTELDRFTASSYPDVKSFLAKLKESLKS